MSVVGLDGVTFGYGGGPPVLEDVSLDVSEGEFLGLIGPNGSGKSTLLEIALGLRRPDVGTATLFGERASEFAEGERIGYVAQNATGATREMPVTVREAVTMGRYPRRLFGRFSSEDGRAVASALDRAGIADLADRRLAHLSGGQRQRVFIARALAAGADLLVLDEPAVGVDVESRERFYSLLGDLNGRGMTVVLVEHDVGVVTSYATEVACLNRRLYFHGEPSEFVETNALAAAYGTEQRILRHDH